MLSWREQKKVKSHGRGRAQLSGNCTEPWTCGFSGAAVYGGDGGGTGL